MDIMLDLETMGTNNNAAIVAIGAVAFEYDPNKSVKEMTRDTFYTTVSLTSAVKNHGVMDAGTVIWWLQQSEAARNELTKPGPMDLTMALFAFNNWMATFNIDEMKVWGNGSDFDNVVLRNAYINNGVPVPWRYNQNRCYRTFKAEFGDGVIVPNVGTAHNALDDAIYQKNMLIAMKDELHARSNTSN